MRRVLTTSLYRVFTSPFLYCCTFGVMAVHLANLFFEMRFTETMNYQSLYWVLDGGFSVMDWILCVVGAGADFCGEIKYGYFRQNIGRCNMKQYCGAKVITAGISGFFCAFAGMQLFHGAAIAAVFLENKTLASVNSVVQKDIMMYILGASLLCALLSMAGLLVSSVIEDKFVAVSMPILLFYIYAYTATVYEFPLFLVPSMIFVALSVGWGYAVSITVLAGYGCYRFLLWRLGRRL